MSLSTMFRRLTDLHALADLGDNWDGEGAPPPSAQAIATAHGHIVAMAEWGLVPDDVAADVLGGVALYWCEVPLKPGWTMWIACHNSGAVTCVISDGERVTSHGMIEAGARTEAA